MNNNNEKKPVLFLLNGNQEGDTRLLSEEQAPNQKLSSKRRKQASRWWGWPPLCYAQCSSSEQSSSHGTQHTHATQLHSGQQLDGEPTLIVRAARDELMMTGENTVTCRGHAPAGSCSIVHVMCPCFFFFWRTVQPMVRVPVCCLHVPPKGL